MPTRATLPVLYLIVVGACTPVAVPPDTPPPRVLGACCPETDAEIIALFRQYESTAQAARPPELALLPHRFSSGLTGRERIVVRDLESWASLWPRIVGSHRPPPPVPPVNFANEMVVVASMGTRPSGGYAIYIDGVSAVRGNLVVSTREVSPGPRCGVTGALTEPVALARLERSDLPVSFVNRSVVRDC